MHEPASPRHAATERLDLSRLKAIRAEEVKAVKDPLTAEVKRVRVTALDASVNLEALRTELRKAESDEKPYDALHLICHGIVSVCDILACTFITTFEVPVSLILGIVGAAVFIALLLRQRRLGAR